jgi:hypothetical protein
MRTSTRCERLEDVDEELAAARHHDRGEKIGAVD